MEDCIFCKIARGEIVSKKIFESANFFVINDVHPKVEGHCLVISKKHFKTMLDMPADLYGEFLETAKEVMFGFLKEKKAEGFNLVINNFEVAGQIVPHVHLHILPRRKGDGFNLRV